MLNPIRHKIGAIKAIRDSHRNARIKPDVNDCQKFSVVVGLGLKESKDLVEQIMAMAVTQFCDDPAEFIRNNEFFTSRRELKL